MDVKEWKKAMDRANEFALQEARDMPSEKRFEQFVSFRGRLRELGLPMSMQSDFELQDLLLRLRQKVS